MDPRTLQLFAPAVIIPLVLYDRAVRHRTLQPRGPEETGVNLMLGGITLLSDGIIVGAFLLFYDALAPHVALFRIDSLAVQVAICFVLGDFLSYVHHRLMHRWPVLWASHIVHHQSRTIDLSAGLRNHPLVMIGTCLAWGLLLPLGVRPAVMLLVAGIIGTYTVFVHQGDWLAPLGRVPGLAFVLNLPQHHRLHHSADEAYYNSNYGLLFIVWDRMFGTYHAPDPEMRRFGVEGVPSTGRVRTLLWWEWSRLLRPDRAPPREDDAPAEGRIGPGLMVYAGAIVLLALMSLLLGFPRV
ncbi:MAG TPA: sterol desaturase family protein [Longimicrobium sp.]|nr:sterol desaturase family protein [Longimicrobium sp.]